MARLVELAEAIVREVMDRQVLTGVGSLRSEETAALHHAVDVAATAAVIGRLLGYDRQTMKKLVAGCLLHDVGKVFVEDTGPERRVRLDVDAEQRLREHPGPRLPHAARERGAGPAGGAHRVPAPRAPGRHRLSARAHRDQSHRSRPSGPPAPTDHPTRRGRGARRLLRLAHQRPLLSPRTAPRPGLAHGPERRRDTVQPRDGGALPLDPAPLPAGDARGRHQRRVARVYWRGHAPRSAGDGATGDPDSRRRERAACRALRARPRPGRSRDQRPGQPRPSPRLTSLRGDDDGARSWHARPSAYRPAVHALETGSALPAPLRDSNASTESGYLPPQAVRQFFRRRDRAPGLARALRSAQTDGAEGERSGAGALHAGGQDRQRHDHRAEPLCHQIEALAVLAERAGNAGGARDSGVDDVVENAREILRVQVARGRPPRDQPVIALDRLLQQHGHHERLHERDPPARAGEQVQYHRAGRRISS